MGGTLPVMALQNKLLDHYSLARSLTYFSQNIHEKNVHVFGNNTLLLSKVTAKLKKKMKQ